MTNIVHDKKGTILHVGDEATFTGLVKEVRDGVAMLGTIPPAQYREFQFQAFYLERTAQGAASREADRQAGAPTPPAVEVPPTPAAPVAEAPDPNSPREKAIAHVMSKGRPRDVAEKIVEENGTLMILEDLAEETAEKAKNEAAANQAAPEEQAKA